jgi:hypothetical protein
MKESTGYRIILDGDFAWIGLMYFDEWERPVRFEEKVWPIGMSQDADDAIRQCREEHHLMATAFFHPPLQKAELL